MAEVPAVLDDSCKATITAFNNVKPPNKSLLIYPNPSSTTVNWYISKLKNVELSVEVYSLTGQLINKTKTKVNSLSIKNYLPGIYFIRISDGESFYSAKFVKQD